MGAVLPAVVGGRLCWTKLRWKTGARWKTGFRCNHERTKAHSTALAGISRRTKPSVFLKRLALLIRRRGALREREARSGLTLLLGSSGIISTRVPDRVAPATSGRVSSKLLDQVAVKVARAGELSSD